jgi:hypothetical protein
MSLFYYSPQVTSVTDQYTNHSGKFMEVVDNTRVGQFKRDTDRAFLDVNTTLEYHTSEIQKLRSKLEYVHDENIALKRMLDWVNSHYPEAMHALDCTMKVHAVLDKSNQPDDGEMQSP